MTDGAASPDELESESGREGLRRALSYVVVLAAGVGVGAAATLLSLSREPPPPIEQTRFLNFDPQTTGPDVLTAGWSGYEHNDRNDSFVWCASQHCTLLVTVYGQRDRRLGMRVWPFRYPDAPPQSALATLNDVMVGRLDVKEDPVVWELTVQKAMWKEGKNTLRFDFDYAQAPASHIEGNNDPRTLAMGFDWLEIVPL